MWKIPACRAGQVVAVAFWLVILLSPPAILAQEKPPAQSDSPPPANVSDEPMLPDGISADFSRLTQTEEGEYLLEGPVTITWNSSRIQADRIVIRESRYVEAEGNVLIVWGGNRIFGDRLSYDLDIERGEVEAAVGQVEGDFLFWAAHAEKIGSDLVRVRNATITTCTQPTPYWSFAVSTATIRIDHYARMWNVRLRAKKMPLLYLPYLIWPVKQDRAPGLLMPEVHSTQDRGTAITEELFLPIGQSADVTLLGRYYTKAGFGGGGAVRFIPNPKGAASFNGFYIRDKVQLDSQGQPTSRYRAEYRQTQEFLNGFRMVADINLVSDFDYFSDFERELNLVSSPTILARLEFSRNGAWTSLNVRELRREQLRSGGASLIQQTLPEIEWRGRSRKLGKSPLYLSFESSLASIQQREKPGPGGVTGEVPPLDVDYLRGDFFPSLSMPLSPWPWLEITPEITYRATHYTQKRATRSEKTVDEGITRQLWTAGVEIKGPKFYKIFERPKSKYSKRYKHSVEPQLSYGFGEAYDRDDELIVYDQVDRVSAVGNTLSYGIVQRLFAKRPRSAQTELPPRADSVFSPNNRNAMERDNRIDFDQALELPLDEEIDESAPQETVEIATFELRQSRSFDRDLSLADLDFDGVNEATSPYSSVRIVGRFNPTPLISLDLRSNYDILYDRFRDATLSGQFQTGLARIGFSWVHRNGLGASTTLIGKEPIYNAVPNDTQVRLNTGLTLFRGKLRADINGSWDSTPPVGRSHITDLRWRIKYSTQCCTFYVERLSRNFTQQDRKDFYFRIDLKGVGKLLDFKR